MLALRLDYLTGRAVATTYNDRGAAEWPPHPARVFSALVATWAEQDNCESPEAEAERKALQWLEEQSAPSLACTEGLARNVVTHYVPTNDPTLIPDRLWTLAADCQHARDRFRLACHEQSEAAAGDIHAARAAAKNIAGRETDLRKAEAKYHQACSAAFAAAGSSTAKERMCARWLLPESRGRQPRTFPSLTLPDPVVHLCWQIESPAVHLAALDRLALRLIRVGHSSSLVHARWVNEAPLPNWIPDEQGELILRVVGAGQFEALRAAFEQHQAEQPRVLPFRAQRYRAADDGRPPSRSDPRHFDAGEWIILKRVGGAGLPLTRGVEVANAVRGALMRHADQPVDEVISGHGPDGAPSRQPHLMILPLAHVGSRHADGSIKGLALLLPKQLDEAGRRPLLRALGRWETQARRESGDVEEDAPTLDVGLPGPVVLEAQRHVWGDVGMAALRTATWCAASREWLSVTPVALDRNPGDLSHGDLAQREAAYQVAAEIIAKACENVGLPLPQSVTVLPSGTWPGGLKARQFPPFPSGIGKFRRVKVHARIRFTDAVAGPVVLGAGRYAGLGLFRPVTQEVST